MSEYIGPLQKYLDLAEEHPGTWVKLQSGAELRKLLHGYGSSWELHSADGSDTSIEISSTGILETLNRWLTEIGASKWEIGA